MPGLGSFLPTYSPRANPFLASVPTERDVGTDEGSRASLTPVLRSLRSSSFFNAHTYHTKMPPDLIEPFVLTFTRPGDIILDPFAGSGMTGVAALKSGRRAILIDLSPAATFLSLGHCYPVDAGTFRAQALAVLGRSTEAAPSLYAVRCSCGLPAEGISFLWSDVVACSRCGTAFRLWDAARSTTDRMQGSFPCPGCGQRLRRSQVRRTGTNLVRVTYLCRGCGRKTMDWTGHDAEDGFPERLIEELQPYLPLHPVERGDMYRSGYHEGIETYADFYSKRNLVALGLLAREVERVPDPALRYKLFFVLTCVAWHATRMRRYNAYGGSRPLNATLYVPGVWEETNVWRLFHKKVETVQRMLVEARDFQPQSLLISTQSATDLRPLPDESVDYIFTDPPYGGNIIYSEVNAIWEAWLGVHTDPEQELVISKHQGKDVNRYGWMLQQALVEAHRVLKRDHFLTVVFNSSKEEVWKAFEDALDRAGFHVESVTILDKGHLSFKQLTSATVAHALAVTARKTQVPAASPRPSRPKAPREVLQVFAARAMAEAGEPGNVTSAFVRTVAKLMNSGWSGALDLAEFLEVARVGEGESGVGRTGGNSAASRNGPRGPELAPSQASAGGQVLGGWEGPG